MGGIRVGLLCRREEIGFCEQGKMFLGKEFDVREGKLLLQGEKVVHEGKEKREVTKERGRGWYCADQKDPVLCLCKCSNWGAGTG